MKKATSVLEFCNIREGTMRQEHVNGYTFDAETRDGVTVELFVYKYGGDWLVNDPVARAKAHHVMSTKRADAVECARNMFSERIDYEKVEQARERTLDAKSRLKIIEEVSA